MKFKMAEKSLFAVLLRSPWWVSVAIGGFIGALAVALLPESWRGAAAMSGFPFFVIGAIAAWRQSKLPSAARIDATAKAVAAMTWPAFAALLEQAFARDGHAVQRASGKDAVDFVLERNGRRMLVSARRWKSARTGLEALRALQAAREAAGDDMPNDALLIGLGELTDNAKPFAAEHRIAVWQAAELAQALRGLALESK